MYRKERKDTMKKQISLIAAVVMIITTLFSNSVFAASLSDVTEDNRYRNAIITLNKLGVIDGYDDGTFKPEGEITRAEFTKMLIAALGYGNNTTEPTEFDDVTEHWARTYIKTAYDMGIINGTGERTFEPDKPVTYEQALKMLVCTINKAYSTGVEYPQGYITLAEGWRLGNNVTDQANSAAAKRQVIAQVVYNALEVEMYEKNSVGIWEKSGKTILNDYLDVVKVKGTLVGVEDTKTNECNVNLIRNQIAVKPTTSSNVIVINLGSFTDMTIGELTKMVGSEMTVYYRQGEADADKELKVIDAETTKNSIKTVSYKNFAGYSSNTFKYIDGPSTKNLKIASGATVIYNGQSISSFPVDVDARLDENDKSVDSIDELLSLWLGTNENYSIRGEVTFTDAGDDGTQDIITINDYKTILALKAPTTSDYRLQNKLKTGEYKDLNPDNVDKKIYIEKDGKEIAATSIKANDVVSYAESLDGSILNVYVSNKTVTGTVNSINSTDGTITISNNEYDLDDACVDYVKEKEGRDLTSGAEGTFYLDKLGTVVYATLKEAEVNPYAYITSINEATNEDTAYLTLYMPSVATKSTTTYKLASKVKINGTQHKSYTSAVEALKESAAYANPDTEESGAYKNTGAENTDYSQPVRVKVSGNEITEIYTLDAGDDGSKIEKNDDPTTIVRYRALANYYYYSSSFKKSSSSSSTEFTVNSKTTVLYVPRDRSEKSEYTKKTASNAFTNYGTYYVEAYDVNSSNVASLVIMYGDSGRLNEVNATTDYSIVAKTPSEVADEDSTTKLISVYAGASTDIKEWKSLTASEFADVVPGDVIQFAYDDDNKIQNRENIITYADMEKILLGAKRDVEYDDETRTEIYNWSEAGNEDSSRNDKFHFKRTGNGTSSTASVYNVYQVPDDGSKLQLTKEGFVDGALRADEIVDIREVKVSSTTKILRMEKNGSEVTFTTKAVDSEADMALTDLYDAKNYGESCSKVIVTMGETTAKLIVVLPEL